METSVYTVRLKDAQSGLVRDLAARNSVSPYMAIKRLVELGMQRVEAGEPLFGGRAQRNFEEAAEEIQAELECSRGREYNMALYLMEITIWLRILGELLKPGAGTEVEERIGKHAARVLGTLHQAPAEAPLRD